MTDGTPIAERIAVHLFPRAERAVRAGHPWVFADGIKHLRRDGTAGELAVVFDSKDRFLGVGLYDPHSPIRIRMLHQGKPVTIDRSWLRQRLREAVQRRASLFDDHTTAGRLVHGPNDALPGLVIDRYDQSLVIKLYTSAWARHLTLLMELVKEIIQPERVILRLSRAVQREGGHGLSEGDLLLGDATSSKVEFLENGLIFEADLVDGHKTGFFLDQRDNRAEVERLSSGKRVLNVFSYTGGFSVYAARGGAREVVSVDISEPALVAAERNLELNKNHPKVAAVQHRTLCGDAFDILEDLVGTTYDMIVLDPPAFAKSRREVDRALAAYQRLGRFALDLLEPGGTLVFASCSRLISAGQLRESVESAAARMRKSLHNVRMTGHPIDHPVGFADGEYLKCLYAVVV